MFGESVWPGGQPATVVAPKVPVEINPDLGPSQSRTWTEERDNHVVCVMEVRDHGVLVMRVDGQTGIFMGLSTFSDGQIGQRQ